MFKGKLITIEGLEGAGKSTAIQQLKEKLKDNDKFLFTREPGGSEVAENIRKIIIENELDPITEFFLFEAARRDHFVNVIFPALQEGKYVIVDRFTDSTFAYQGFHNRIGVKNIISSNNLATTYTNFETMSAMSMQPDLTIFLDIEFKESQKRIRLRENNNRLDRLNEDEFINIKNGYETSFNLRNKKDTIKVVDTTKMTERDVVMSIQKILIDFFKTTERTVENTVYTTLLKLDEDE